ncbi:hypothetical protein IV203_035868 [Nitzschia inconspicua]|uniref:Uncharacterized protein n=1 Tax=Nitzschia inconspicua TaxID=303405 RepID=A0A9K3LE73_9STRA|nr:hypothetical protein IV203_035868 [Nitzschia inconspicua]
MARNPCYAICWILLLFLFAWPIAFVCSFLWIFLLPFEGCCPMIADCNSFFEKFVTWPRDVGAAIANCQSNCPQP